MRPCFTAVWIDCKSSPLGVTSSPGDTGQHMKTFLVVITGGRVAWPGVLLNTLLCIDGPTTKEVLAPNVNRAEDEKPWTLKR